MLTTYAAVTILAAAALTVINHGEPHPILALLALFGAMLVATELAETAE